MKPDDADTARRSDPDYLRGCETTPSSPPRVALGASICPPGRPQHKSGASTDASNHPSGSHAPHGSEIHCLQPFPSRISYTVVLSRFSNLLRYKVFRLTAVYRYTHRTFKVKIINISRCLP